MTWTLVEDTNAPAMRWQARLTSKEPDSGWQPLMRITTPTLQVEGTFGEAVVEVRGSNSGVSAVTLDIIRIADLVAVPIQAYLLNVRVRDADETTDLIVTLAGRR